MNEQVKKRKQAQKRTRHEATKKRTREQKMMESDAIRRKALAEQDVSPPAEKHSDFMTKKRR